MYECALRIHISEGKKTLGGAATHPANTIAPCPHQLVGDVGAIRAVPPAQSKVDSRLRILAYGRELQRWGNAPVFGPQQAERRNVSNVQPALDRALCIVCRSCRYVSAHNR